MLQKLLKEFLGDDAKVTEFLNKMKENKIYTASEENLDTRYSKLKGDFDALTAKEQEAQTLIEQLKTSNKGNEDLQGKITAYETKISDLEKQNQALKMDNAIKFELLAKGAKASDIDYLMFKAKQGDELKLDKEGNVKGLDAVVEGLKKTCQSNFEDSQKKKVDVKDLPTGDNHNETMTKEEFLKKSYAERAQFANDNPEAFQELIKQ